MTTKVTLQMASTVEGLYGIAPMMGADPEVFLSKGGAPVAAFEYLPSKVVAAKGLKAGSDNYTREWFWDGFQAETTMSPMECHTSFMFWWKYQIYKLLMKGLAVRPGAVWRVPKELLQSAEESHVGLGCMPSYNAYQHEGKTVSEPRALPVRFAGGHLHFGHKLPEARVTSTVKALDCFIGIPTVAMFERYDNPIRRQYYGLAGEFRTPKHGLEYRTLSNAWLMHPQAFQLVMDLARAAFNLGRMNYQSVWIGDERMVEDTINNCDVKSARDLMKLNKSFFDMWLDVRYGNGKKSFWSAVNGGIEEVLKDFADEKAFNKVWSVIDGNQETDLYRNNCLWRQLK